MSGRESAPATATVLRRLRRLFSSTLGQGVMSVCGFQLLVAVWNGALQWLQMLDTADTVLLVVPQRYLLVRMLGPVQRRFLWRW